MKDLHLLVPDEIYERLREIAYKRRISMGNVVSEFINSSPVEKRELLGTGEFKNADEEYDKAIETGKAVITPVKCELPFCKNTSVGRFKISIPDSIEGTIYREQNLCILHKSLVRREGNVEEI